MGAHPSQAYSNFRAWVPRKRLTVGPHSNYDWLYYDWGPRTYPEPLICLHDLLGSAEVFHRQIISLSPLGYRVISIALPNTPTLSDFRRAFHSFLDTLRITKCHVYGAGLGGFLALAAATEGQRIQSVILTHAWITSESVRRRVKQGPGVIKWMPEFMVRGTMRHLCPRGKAEKRIAGAIQFVVDRTLLDEDKDALVARLLLLTSVATVAGRVNIPQDKVTILDTLDRTDSLAPQLAKDITAEFPRARLALLKRGGEFPYLSCPDEINMHLIVHMRRHAPPPAETMTLPPPAFVPPSGPVVSTDEGSIVTSTRDKDVEAMARAQAQEEEKKRLTKYEEQIAIMRKAMPKLSDTYLAAVLSDNNGIVDVALCRLKNNEYPPNYNEILFDHTLCAAVGRMQRSARKNDSSSDEPVSVPVQQTASDSKEPDAAVADNGMREKRNDVHTPSASVKPRSGVTSRPKSTSESRRKVKSATFGRYTNEEADQVSAYLTSGKASPRKTSLVSRGPTPFPFPPIRRSAGHRYSDPSLPSATLSEGGGESKSPSAADDHAVRNTHEPSSRQDLFNRGLNHSGNMSDEWHQFRQSEGDPLSKVTKTTALNENAAPGKKNADVGMDDERLREWKMAASSAMERK